MDRLAKPAPVSGRPLRTAFPTRVRYVAVPTESVPTAVRWSFLLFALTLPFEAADLGFMSGSLSLGKISGLIFIASYFLYHNPLSQKRTFPPVPYAIWWFLGYVAIYALNGLFIPEQFVSEFFTRLITLVQLMVLLWIASSLLKEEKMARGFLLTYSMASVVLALAIILRLPGFAEIIAAREERVTALGNDPNNLAVLMALAAVMLIGLYLNMAFRHLRSKIVLLVLTLPLLVLIVSTGSRTGVVAFMIGCSVYLLPLWRSKRRLAAVALAILGIIAMVYTASSNPDFLERWHQAYYEGNLAGRQNIFSAAFEMFLERPIFGWKPIELWHELGFRRGIWRELDAHNLFLHLLLEVGVVGAIPFLVGLWLCGWAAWRARTGNLGLLPLALLLTTLAANMALTDLTRKPMWFVLALTLAAASAVARGWGKRARVLLVRRPFQGGR